MYNVLSGMSFRMRVVFFIYILVEPNILYPGVYIQKLMEFLVQMVRGALYNIIIIYSSFVAYTTRGASAYVPPFNSMGNHSCR